MAKLTKKEVGKIISCIDWMIGDRLCSESEFTKIKNKLNSLYE